MKKIPFTPDGMQILLSQLYQLPQAELQMHVDALATSFKLWIVAHFEFSLQNEMYLENLSVHDLRYLGTISSFFIENRLPIRLIQNKPPKLVEDEYEKIIKSSSSVEIAVKKGKPNKASSSELVFEIFYQA